MFSFPKKTKVKEGWFGGGREIFVLGIPYFFEGHWLIPISYGFGEPTLMRSCALEGFDFLDKAPKDISDKILSLWNFCAQFIDLQEIYCSEKIYQNDEVGLNALEFIEQIVNLVGFKKDPEESK